jgi:hypothetical protein
MSFAKTTAAMGAMVLGITSLHAFAQAAATEAPAPKLKDLHLSCSDFKHNPDGSWSALHPVQVGADKMPPGVAFREGVAISGVDVGALLNQECKSAAPIVDPGKS